MALAGYGRPHGAPGVDISYIDVTGLGSWPTLMRVDNVERTARRWYTGLASHRFSRRSTTVEQHTGVCIATTRPAALSCAPWGSFHTRITAEALGHCIASGWCGSPGCSTSLRNSRKP
jgi:hypothetical protein